MYCPNCQGNYDFNDIEIRNALIVCEGCGVEFNLVPTGKIYKEG